MFSRCFSVCLAALSTVDCGVWSGHACLPHLPELVPEIVADPVYFTCANEGLTNAKHAASPQRLQSGRLLTCWNCLEISSPHNYSPTLPPLRVKIAPHSLLAHPHPHAWLDFVQTSRRPWVCQQDFSKATDEMLHKVSNGAANGILHLSGMSKPLRQNLC